MFHVDSIDNVLVITEAVGRREVIMLSIPRVSLIAESGRVEISAKYLAQNHYFLNSPLQKTNQISEAAILFILLHRNSVLQDSSGKLLKGDPF